MKFTLYLPGANELRWLFQMYHIDLLSALQVHPVAEVNLPNSVGEPHVYIVRDFRVIGMDPVRFFTGNRDPSTLIKLPCSALGSSLELVLDIDWIIIQFEKVPL